MSSLRDIRTLFDPAAVAVIGATDRAGSVGRALLENLRDFEGDVVAVNPDRETVLGFECYPDIRDAPPVELAVVAVPPSVVVEVVEDVARAGIDTVVVITAGFSESGSEGAKREQELRTVARQEDLLLIGPNSLGVMSTRSGLNASFGPGDPLPGSVAFMSQSGAFITAVLDWAESEELGFRDIASLGNKAVIDETDLVAAWGADEDTSVVIGYLESIEDGRAFLETARAVTTDTPIVVVKSGRTQAGARAASSHTGAIAGSERAYEAALDQAGVLRAGSVQSLFDYTRVLEGQPLPETGAVAVVTNAGGPGVMATDAIGDANLDLASFGPETRDRLDEVLPDTANTHNPVDVVGDAGVERFEAALDAVLADEQVGAGVVIAAPTAILDLEELGEAIGEVQREHGTPVVAAMMGGDRVQPAVSALRDVGIPNYFDPARAVESLEAARWQYNAANRPVDEPTTFAVDREQAELVLQRVRNRESNRLGVEAMELLDAYDIPIPRGEVVDSPTDATAVAAEMEGDVVMKIVSPDILHKSDIGGVQVGISPESVADTYENLIARARNYQPDATILGVQVQEQVNLDDATETIVGVNRDPGFGPLILFGLGGVFVEVFEDTSVRIAPVGERTARSMVEEVKAAPLLRGARGREPADIEAIVEVVQRLSQLAMDFPAILELDVNPLVAGPDGAMAVDLRLTVDPSEL